MHSSLKSSPYVTFQLHCKKQKDENSIVWKSYINETIMNNGYWFISIKAINLFNMHCNVSKEKKLSNLFQVSVNLVKNEFNWYSKVNRFVYGNSKPYPDWHPIAYASIDSPNEIKEMSVREQEQELKYGEVGLSVGENFHEINNLTNTLEIVMKPVEHDSNKTLINSMSCDASILVSIYN